MIDRKKLLLSSIVPVLACSLFTGIATASHKKKKTDTATATTPAATSTASTSKMKKKTETSAATASPAKTTPPSKSAAPAAGAASSSEIAGAKAKGMVWVNTDSKVYHSGGKYYGTTKHGQFMSVADAQKAGYRESKK